jgi:hypothetical protein
MLMFCSLAAICLTLFLACYQRNLKPAAWQAASMSRGAQTQPPGGA